MTATEGAKARGKAPTSIAAHRRHEKSCLKVAAILSSAQST
jgi:hypothetical protein